MYLMANMESLNERTRELVECEGLRLETVFIDDRVPETLVMVRRVAPLLGGQPANMDVIKFSERRFAIPEADTIQFGTHGYYREYEGKGVGIRDEMEGHYEEDMTEAVLRQMGLPSYGVSLSARAKKTVSDQWIFCASLVRDTADSWNIGAFGREFGYECATKILDPAMFALELGGTFANHTTWDDVQLKGNQRALQRLAFGGDIKRTVHVYHGPVCYPAAPAKVLDAFPEEHKPQIVPFLKRPEYQWQREYRFVVSFLGEPQAKQLYLPITAGLRTLTGVAWEGSARSELGRESP